MAEDLSSLPLHRAAKKYYQEAGHLPSKPPTDWLAHIWRSLASLVVLLGGYKGLIKLRRDRTSNQISRRILAVPLKGSVPDSVRKLRAINDEIQERIQRRRWRAGELDEPRWRHLRDLIDDRIREAKGNLTRELVSEIHTVERDAGLDETTRRMRQGVLRERLWGCLEIGELDASQYQMLLGILEGSH